MISVVKIFDFTQSYTKFPCHLPSASCPKSILLSFLIAPTVFVIKHPWAMEEKGSFEKIFIGKSFHAPN